MRAVKLSLSLLALGSIALSLCACNTLANRRSLYAPKKGDGYWTRSLHDGSYRKRGTKPADQTVKKGGSQNAQPSAPIPPPPPLPPAQEPAIETPPPAI